MFKDTEVFTTFSVNDLAKAKDFYANTLGLNVSEVFGMLQIKTPAGNKIIIYPKDDHTPASFTVLNFPVENIEQVINALKSKQVKFEVYNDGPGKTDENGISSHDSMKAAWFKDPAGNILALLQGM